MVILILFVILLLGIFFTIFGLGESGFSFFVVLILLVSIAWCYLDGIHHIPQTQKMIPYAIGSLTVIAIIDQIICIVQYQKRRTYISGNYRNPTARTWGKSKLLFIFIITALILFVLLKTQIGTEMKDSLIKSLGNTSFTSNFGSDEYQEDDLENLVLYIDDYDNFNIDTDSYYEISNEDIVSASTSLNAHTVDKIFDNDPETNWQEGEEGAGIGEYFDISFENEREIGGLGFALGNWKSEADYYANNRPSKIILQLNDTEFDINFSDEYIHHYICFSEPVYINYISITIDDVYEGEEYDDTVVSEMGIFPPAD